MCWNCVFVVRRTDGIRREDSPGHRRRSLLRPHTHTDIPLPQVARFCALQDAARFHAVCQGWDDGLGAPASPFYPEVRFPVSQCNSHRPQTPASLPLPFA